MNAEWTRHLPFTSYHLRLLDQVLGSLLFTIHPYHLPVIGSLQLTIPPFTICQLTNVEAKEMLQDHPRQLPCLCLHSGVFGFNSFQMQEADHSPGYD